MASTNDRESEIANGSLHSDDSPHSSSEEVVGWHRREAEHCEEKQQWSDAVRHLDLVVAADPGCWSDHWSRSEFHAQLDHWEKAVAGYLKVIELGPDDDYVWYSLALARLGT